MIGATNWRERALRAEAEHERMAEAWRAECKLREHYQRENGKALRDLARVLNRLARVLRLGIEQRNTHRLEWGDCPPTHGRVWSGRMWREGEAPQTPTRCDCGAVFLDEYTRQKLDGHKLHERYACRSVPPPPPRPPTIMGYWP